MQKIEYNTDENMECYQLYEFPHFINDTENQVYIDFIDKCKIQQVILHNRDISKMIETKIFSYISNGKFPLYHIKNNEKWEFVGCSPCITISKHKAPYFVKKHKDQPKDQDGKKNLTKFIIYLNEDTSNPQSGGTVFFDKNQEKVAFIKREKNKAGLFDIRQLHSGGALKTGIKYMIGARLLYVKK